MLCFLPFFHVFPLHPTPLITIYKTDLIIFLSLFQKNTSNNFPPLSSWSSGRAVRIRPNSQRARDRNKMRPGCRQLDYWLQDNQTCSQVCPQASCMSTGLMHICNPQVQPQAFRMSIGLRYGPRPLLYPQVLLHQMSLKPSHRINVSALTPK